MVDESPKHKKSYAVRPSYRLKNKDIKPKPKKVIYRQLELNAGWTGQKKRGDLNVRYTDHGIAFDLENGDNIFDFIECIFDNPGAGRDAYYSKIRKNDPNVDDQELRRRLFSEYRYSARGERNRVRTEGRLGIEVNEDCYLVFELSPSWNWQFSTRGDCFSTHEEKNSVFSSLVHIDPDRTSESGFRQLPVPDGSKPSPIDDGCRILLMQCRGSKYGTINAEPREKFSLHTEFFSRTINNAVLPEYSTHLIIDPDVGNGGGGNS